MKIFLILLLSVLELTQLDAQFSIGNKNDLVYDFCYSKDGSILVVPLNNKIEILETVSYSIVKTLSTEQQTPILAIDINSSGENIVTCGKDSSIVIRDIKTDRNNVLLRYQSSCMITEVKYSPNDRLMATVTNNNDIIVRDALTLESKFILKQHSDYITDIEFIGNTGLISCSADHSIIIWDIIKEEAIARWKAGNQWIRDVSINKSLNKVASCGDDGRITLWNISDIHNVRKISTGKQSSDWLMSCDFFDDNTFAVAGHNKRVKIYTPFGNYDYKTGACINKIAFMPNNYELIVAIATHGSGLIIVNAKDLNQNTQ